MSAYITQTNIRRKITSYNKLEITPKRVKYIEPEDLWADEHGKVLVDTFQEEVMKGFILIKHPGQQPGEQSHLKFSMYI